MKKFRFTCLIMVLYMGLPLFLYGAQKILPKKNSAVIVETSISYESVLQKANFIFLWENERSILMKCNDNQLNHLHKLSIPYKVISNISAIKGYLIMFQLADHKVVPLEWKNRLLYQSDGNYLLSMDLDEAFMWANKDYEGTYLALERSSDDAEGIRFRCDINSEMPSSIQEYPFECPINFSFLKKGCEVYLFNGGGLPAEINQKAVLKKGNLSKQIVQPDDLTDCVDIKNPEDALEFLRFFSSYDTIHLFKDQNLEAYNRLHYPDCVICMAKDKWRKWKMQPPQVIITKNGFKITRFMLLHNPENLQNPLSKTTELVSFNGKVKKIKEESMLTPASDLGNISFPVFP